MLLHFVQLFVICLFKTSECCCGVFCFTCYLLSVSRCHCLSYCLFRSCKPSYLSSFYVLLIHLIIFHFVVMSHCVLPPLSLGHFLLMLGPQIIFAERSVAMSVPHKGERKDRGVSLLLMQTYTNR